MSFRRVAFGCFALLLFVPSAHSVTPIDDGTDTARHKMEAARVQMQGALEKKQCPEMSEWGRSPEIGAVCPKRDCRGLSNADLDKCSDSVFGCINSYKVMLETVSKYNKFLEASCTEAAKNRAAEKSAVDARERAKQIEDSNFKRDLR
jgi:hypothetical protein